MEINWAQLEDAVFRSVIQVLNEFASHHKEEIFYCFYLDCNATYFQILGHLNTEELLRVNSLEAEKKRIGFSARLEHNVTEEFLRELIHKGNMEHSRKLEETTIESLMEEHRWDAAEFGYFDMFCASGHDEAYDRITTGMYDYYTESRGGVNKPIYESFLEMACRAAIRLEKENAFNVLKCTSDFRVFCSDHDEAMEESENRLSKVRESLRSLPPEQP